MMSFLPASADDSTAPPAPEPVEDPAASQELDYPRGLIPPTKRGRSQSLIGDIVVDLGFARRDDVDTAVNTSREQGRTTGQQLLHAGHIRQDQLARALAERFGLDYVDLSEFDVDMGAVNLVTLEVAKRYQAVPVGFFDEGTVILAMADPTNVLTIDELSMITGMKVRPAAAGAQDVSALISRLNRFDEAVAEIELEDEPESTELKLADAPDSDAPIVKLVHSIIGQAVEQGASDIHFDPEAGDMKVQFRIDGVLAQAATIARRMAPGVISRVKIMANLDIAEKRLPQDGRLAVTIEGRRIDVRVVTLPLVKGEGVVMRILDTRAVVRELDALGMQESERDKFVSAVTKPYGAVLVTGPTGSGKSTTLYGALSVVNDGEKSILTIEDPVESQIAGIKQMQVSVKTGVTFAVGLRSMLRADPDVIMVGEIRDRETAEIAIQAALTGHLVLSTLHTRDAASALGRLTDMGIEPFMVSAAIDCVVAQRLARQLCANCKRVADVPDSVRESDNLWGVELYEPVGCMRCGNTGYQGRLGLYEVMPLNDEIRTMVIERRSVSDIAAAAARTGMRTMRDDGLEKARRGLTSLAEVARVTNVL
jgi:type IV pilus assembly protein PilB